MGSCEYADKLTYIETSIKYALESKHIIDGDGKILNLALYRQEIQNAIEAREKNLAQYVSPNSVVKSRNEYNVISSEINYLNDIITHTQYVDTAQEHPEFVIDPVQTNPIRFTLKGLKQDLLMLRNKLCKKFNQKTK